MSTGDPISVIQALVSATSHEHPTRAVSEPLPPVVTVSRDYGALGEEVATAIAERLYTRLYDAELLDAMARSAHVRPELMAELDERVRDNLTSWVHSMLRARSLFTEDFRRHLVTVLHGIARQGGVVVGRGSHLILAGKPNVLRIRVSGSEAICASRIARAEGLTQEAALRKVREINHERDVFLRALGRMDPHPEFPFDIILNSDRLDTAQMADIVYTALERMGLLIPAGHHSGAGHRTSSNTSKH